jgi:hypothetical protein
MQRSEGEAGQLCHSAREDLISTQAGCRNVAKATIG